MSLALPLLHPWYNAIATALPFKATDIKPSHIMLDQLALVNINTVKLAHLLDIKDQHMPMHLV